MAKWRINVGVDFHEWDGIFQGSRNHVLGIYKKAILMAPDIFFVFFLSDVDSLRDQHVEFSRPNVKLVRMRSLGGLLRLFIQLPFLCIKYKIDVLHTQYRTTPFRVCRRICTIHDILFESHPQFFSRFFRFQASLTFKWAANVAEHVFTVSQYSKSELIKIYGIPEDKVSVTYNGVDPDRFYPGNDGLDIVKGLGLKPGEYILTVGRLEPRKNHISLISAWKSSLAFNSPLVIVGQADSNFPNINEEIISSARNLPVIQLKNLGDDELPYIIRHAKFFAYPAFAEGFGMPVAEAMASGVPVITSNTTSLAEVAGNGAILCNPNDYISLENSLNFAFSLSDDDRSNLIDQALHQVSQFDWNKSARILLNKIRECVDTP